MPSDYRLDRTLDSLVKLFPIILLVGIAMFVIWQQWQLSDLRSSISDNSQGIATLRNSLLSPTFITQGAQNEFSEIRRSLDAIVDRLGKKNND